MLLGQLKGSRSNSTPVTTFLGSRSNIILKKQKKKEKDRRKKRSNAPWRKDDCRNGAENNRNLKHLLVPVYNEFLKQNETKSNDGNLSKGHRSQLKELPVAKTRTAEATK